MQIDKPFPWGAMDTREWERAFSIPTLPWTEPFISLLGLPTAMNEHPEVWNKIYLEAIADYQHRWDTEDWEIGTVRGYTNLVQQVFSKAFQKLSKQLGEQTAIDFEKWILFYFFDKKFELAMKSWLGLLRYTCRPNVKYELFSLPTALELLLSDIFETVSFETEKWINKSIYEVAPAPPGEQIEYERLEHVYEALVIKKIIEKASIFQVLQLLNSRFTIQDKKEFIEWAEAQSLLWYRIAYPGHLRPDLYLVNGMPTINLPLKLSIISS
jgi:hypothetical protein